MHHNLLKPDEQAQSRTRNCGVFGHGGQQDLQMKGESISKLRTSTPNETLIRWTTLVAPSGMGVIFSAMSVRNQSRSRLVK